MLKSLQSSSGEDQNIFTGSRENFATKGAKLNDILIAHVLTFAFVMPEILIEVLKENDLDEAERIARLAFGTFLDLPDPTQMFGDRLMIKNRWKANPDRVLGAYLKGELVGSNVVTRWGTFGFFGPLSIRPDLWDRGIAKQLLGPTMNFFYKWKTKQEGLFTFAGSPKHLGLYQKFGFSARFLTAIMEKKVEKFDSSVEYTTLSDAQNDFEEVLGDCRNLTWGIYEGLDLTEEIKGTQRLKLGDTVLIRENSRITGFAVCHVGKGTEAGSDTCYIKFGTASNSSGARNFRNLLHACEDFAFNSGVRNIEAGTNLARHAAYQEMLSHGFRSEFLGVAMQRPNQAGFNREDVFAIDDWR